MKTESNREVDELARVSSSPAMLRFADSILRLDRETVAKLVAAYFYFKSLGETDRDFLFFLATKRTGTTLDVGSRLLPTLASGVLTDKDFRSLMLGIMRSAVRRPAKDQGVKVVP